MRRATKTLEMTPEALHDWVVLGDKTEHVQH